MSLSQSKTSGRGEVVDLARAVAGAAQLDGYLRTRGRSGRGDGARTGAGQREAAARAGGDLGVGVTRDIGEVGDPAEHAVPAVQFEDLAVCRLHRAAAGQRQHDPLAVPGGEGVRPAGRQVQDAQAGVVPAGPLGVDVEGVRAALRRRRARRW